MHYKRFLYELISDLVLVSDSTESIMMDVTIMTVSEFNFHWQAWSSASLNGAENKGTELISGQYLLNNSISDTLMPHVQKFILSKHKIDHLRLEILTNHGNVGYTCIYKVKLFGKVA